VNVDAAPMPICFGIPWDYYFTEQVINRGQEDDGRSYTKFAAVFSWP